MSPVILVGMVVGTLVILTALAISWNKKEFSAGGLGALVSGVVLIGMSQWSKVNVRLPGAELQIQALEKKVDSTAASAALVANEAKNTAATTEVMRKEIATLTTQLAEQRVTPQTATAIRAAIEAAPRTDTARLRIATDKLHRVTAVKVPLRP